MTGRSVVVGEGIAGLLTAAALHGQSDEIVVLERDDVPAEPAARSGVPQGSQVHALLSIGVRTMDQLLPGLVDDLIVFGAVPLDASRDVAVYSSQGWIARVPSEAHVVAIRRPHLEHVLRQRVRALPGVTSVRDGAVGLAATSDGRRVTGVELASGETLDADLTIDASGRRSKAPEWIERLGYAPPAEVSINSHIGYATATVRLPDEALPPGVAAVVAHPNPRNLYGAAILPCGNGLSQLAALGMMRNHPPGDTAGFMQHLDRAPSPIVGELARRVEFVEPVATYRMLGSQRRLWEQLPARPEGFAAIGDSVMSFNPLYGQGMSLAAAEALAFADIVAERGLGADGLADALQTSIASVIDVVFGMVLDIDGHYPGVELTGVEPPDPEAARYNRALAQLATQDAEASLAMKYAAHFFDTSLSRSEAMRAKVEEWISSGALLANNDPQRIPDALTASGITT